MRPAATWRCDQGFVTIQYLLAVGLSLVVMVLMTNFIVIQYARGVVRGALDEGVRAGSRARASELDCEERAKAALADLLQGPMGDEVSAPDCRIDPSGRIEAIAKATFRTWLPPVQRLTFHVKAGAFKEQAP
ncbi:MAG: hypothetical protein ACRDJK_02050 [Actinomycetota bacterium]